LFCYEKYDEKEIQKSTDIFLEFLKNHKKLLRTKMRTKIAYKNAYKFEMSAAKRSF